MKIRILTAFCAAFCAVCAETVTLKVATDHPDCLYACGDEAAFTVTALDAQGAPAKAGTLEATIDNFGNRKMAARTIDLAQENPFTLKARKEIPGFLRLMVTSRTKGLTVKPTGGQGSIFAWGVAYEPTKIQPGAACPQDFDAFWADAVKKLDETVPVDARMEEIPAKSNKNRTYYRVSFASAGGRRVWGWLSMPKGKGPFPVDVSVPGAGIGALGTGGDAHRISLTMNVHSYPQPDTDAARQAAYKAQDAKYAAPCGVARYCQAGIHVSREDYFYYASLLGINRAVNWLWARPEVDRAHFTYFGTSQGGGFGFMLTGLNGHFTRSCIFVPAITDLLGFRQDDRQSGWPRIVEAQREENKAAAEKWAPYFDGVNFAARITCPVRVVAGFADCVCTPCGVYAAYNLIPSKDKKIIHGIGMGHGVYGELYRDLAAWRTAR
ncbi:MAG: acetylxylan esterase [Kiritimatiellia bacterium]